MNELLLSEVSAKEQSLLNSFSLIENFVFPSSPTNITSLNQLVEVCQACIAEIEAPLDKVEHLINLLFVEQMFIDKDKPVWPSDSFKMDYSLQYKLVSPVLKAVLIRHIFEQCDFDSDIVFIPEKVMVRVTCDDYYAIIFDPISGESIDAGQLDERLDDVDSDPMDITLDSMSKDTLIVEHLTLLKNSLIYELKFDQALKCVDILLALRPDDPFERRDRGFLLHQLDCFKVAYDDYQYFVEQCPKDPAAQLLKLQLDQVTITDSVLH